MWMRLELMRARQEKTSLPFLELITLFCEREKVLYKATIDVRVTLVSSCDIRRIENGCLQGNMAKRKLSPQDTMPVVYPTKLDAEAIWLGVRFHHDKAFLVCTIKDKENIYVGVITTYEI